MIPLRRLIDYDSWANRETLGALRRTTAPARSLRWMGHIIGAELLWLARLQGRPPSLPVWPDLSVNDCAQQLGQVSSALLESAVASQLDRRVAYTNSKGEAWTSTVEEILTHVVIHSAYHRGQIASDLRAAGQEPPYTDYIHAVRQRLIE